ncbi:MAG: ATP-binding protein [Lachnospiraceae bacterium]|nr:ATP-binding protein [Lachnospiraceae bacterium]
MQPSVKLPIGIEDFQKIRTEGFYYVDKTALLTELLNNWGEVNLFTRPRRFGKSLNMSMLKYFFSCGCDAGLFDGLAISRETGLCEKYMGKFPVISITLKGVDALEYNDAQALLCSVIGNEALRFQFLLESERLSDKEKEQYARLIEVGAGGQQMFFMTKDVLVNSLKNLSSLLCKHYGQKVILLIDEYDVPLDKAQQHGYYDEMTDLIRGLFGQVLKGNENLYFAVLTGCLRIAKESIFTGLNNFKVLSITNAQFDEHFGFSDTEVKAMLEYYGLKEKHALIKEWYDGYRFGKADVYCPWDVINYANQLRFDPDARPRAFWINSSGNAILRTLLEKATPRTRQELGDLVSGACITKKINEELTYRELYDTLDNIWSVLFTTGYLTKQREVDLNTYELVIPNQEICMIFNEQILTWFQEETQKDTPSLDAFCKAFQKGDAEEIERRFTAYLKKTISIRDTAVRKNKKENFYHGILLGLLSFREDWIVQSNVESGTGYSDIQIELTDEDTGIVIELKYAESSNLEAGCQEAL